tara:strand:- start:578 stop:892 length:315 start_codon:yes stop_codon:yes gene_type:complete
MEVDWIDIAVTISTTGLFALIGFVWRASHKITVMSQRVDDLSRRVGQIECDHDKAMDRIYSIVKDRSNLMSKESYREDSREIQRAIQMAHYKLEQEEKERNRNA